MADISVPDSNPNLERPKSIIFRKSIASSIDQTESDHSSNKIQATGTMREAFPPSLPPGSPDLGKISTTATTSSTVTKPQRKVIITQQSCHQLETPKVRSVNTIISGNSPKKDKDSFIDFSKTRKTTTTIFGHQSPNHRNSSPNTKYNFHNTGSPTLKSDLKSHFERDSSGTSGLTTTISAVATSTSLQTGTSPSVLALADTTSDGMQLFSFFLSAIFVQYLFLMFVVGGVEKRFSIQLHFH